MYINLQGGPAQMPPQFSHENGGGYGPGYGGNQGQQYHGQQHHGGQGGYPGQQQQHHGGNDQQQQQNAEIEAAVKKFLPRIIRKLEGCCIVM